MIMVEVEEAFIANGYSIKKVLGEGCWGTVYLVTDSKETPLCIKSESMSKHALFEQQAIKDIYAYESILFEVDHVYYFTMPYFEGTTLEEAKKEGLSLIEKIQIAEKIKQEMERYFKKGYIHRDIHPSNIIYNPNDNENPISIVDFGRATRLADPNKSLPYHVFRLFLQPQTAPEYVYFWRRDEIGFASDIYSFGRLLKRFFPEATAEISVLYDYFDVQARNEGFAALETSLKRIFNAEKNKLINACTKLIEGSDAERMLALKQLKASIELLEVHDKTSICVLQTVCSDFFDDFESTAVHRFLISVFEILAYFGFMSQDTVLKYKMRAFIEPEPEEPTPSLCLGAGMTA